MHIVFLEKRLSDGKFEITIRQGKEELKRLIDKSYTFPEKLVLTGEQREENKDCMKDILTGAFCLQELEGITFLVVNERGDAIEDYNKSIYDDVQGGVRM